VQDSILLWLDLEMTGLNPEQDSILEIAALVSDMQLSSLTEGPSLVIYQPADALGDMNDWVSKQHTASGLLEKVAQSKITIEQAEEQVLEFLDAQAGKKNVYLAGNSIYVDRSFLSRYMPKLNQRCHYRVLDVSSFKIVIQGWYADQKEADFKKKKTHRALDDIRESINELKQYREYFFKKS
jgi:oligoribonuclease